LMAPAAAGDDDQRVRAAAVVLAFLALTASASAERGLIVGVDDDWLKWTAHPARLVHAYGDLDLGGLRVTLQWRQGQSHVDGVTRLYLRRVSQPLPPALRVVLSVYGTPAASPRSTASRAQYCSFVA